MSSDNVVELAAKQIPTPRIRKGGEEEEFGIHMNMPFGAWFDSVSTDDGGAEIANTNPVDLDQLVEMRRRDGQARALMRLFTLPVRQALKDARWIDEEDGDDESPEAQLANDMFFSPPNMGGMTTPMPQVVRETLLALMEGFSAFEEVRHVPKEGPLAGKVALKKLAHRDSRTIRFRVTREGEFAGFRQIATRPGSGETVDVVIPPDKSWYWANQEEENPFYGVSLFESAYHHYDAKKRLYYIAHLAAQAAAVPGRVGTVPKNTDPTRITAFRNAIRDFAFNQAMTMPEGFSLDPFNMNTQFDFLKLIDHHNHQMSKSVLAGFIDEEPRSALIENSMKDAATDMFVMSIEALMNEIAESWSITLMPKFIDWNIGSKKYPKFKWGELADSTRDAIKDMLQAISTAQSSKWTDEFIREMEKRMASRLGLEIDYDEIEEREEKERAEMEKQQSFQQEFLQQQLRGGQAPGGPPEQGPPQLPPGAGPPGAEGDEE